MQRGPRMPHADDRDAQEDIPGAQRSLHQMSIHQERAGGAADAQRAARQRLALNAEHLL